MRKRHFFFRCALSTLLVTECGQWCLSTCDGRGFGDTGLPAYSEETEPWSSLEGGLLAQALHAKSQKIGCAVTKNCDQGNVIICFFDPSLQENETPFRWDMFKFPCISTMSKPTIICQFLCVVFAVTPFLRHLKNVLQPAIALQI